MNTPSLSSQDIVVNPGLLPSSLTTATSSTNTNIPDHKQQEQNVVPGILEPRIELLDVSGDFTFPNKRPSKPLPNSDLQVTPLLPYSKVAKASSNLEELQKEVRSKVKVLSSFMSLKYFLYMFCRLKGVTLLIIQIINFSLNYTKSKSIQCCCLFTCFVLICKIFSIFIFILEKD